MFGCCLSHFFSGHHIEQRRSSNGSAKNFSCRKIQAQYSRKPRKDYELEKGKGEREIHKVSIKTSDSIYNELEWAGDSLGMDSNNLSSHKQSISDIHKRRRVCLPGFEKVSCSLDVFSHFFSLVGSSVKIHSTITGQIVSTLKSPSSSSTSSSQPKVLSCAVINPHNPFQLITGSLDGSLMIWDFLDGSLLKTIEIAQPVHYLCVHEKFKDYVFVAVSRPSKNTKQGMSPNLWSLTYPNLSLL